MGRAASFEVFARLVMLRTSTGKVCFWGRDGEGISYKAEWENLTVLLCGQVEALCKKFAIEEKRLSPQEQDF